jgi:hypothetical protein
VKYELGFYIPEDDILRIHHRENLKSYTELTGRTLLWRRNVSAVRYELGFYIPEDGILHNHRLENLTSHMDLSRNQSNFSTSLTAYITPKAHLIFTRR